MQELYPTGQILGSGSAGLGNLYVLDQECAVHYINFYGGRTSARRINLNSGMKTRDKWLQT